MILEEAMNQLLRQSTDVILGTDDYAIRGRQSAPRPTTPYAVVNFMTDNQVGWDQNTYENNIDDDLDVTTEGFREIMFSIDFLKDNAYDNARKVRTAIVRESVQQAFRALGVGLGLRSEVRDLSVALEGNYEERAQFTIVLHAIGVDTDIINSIMFVNISGIFDNGSTQTPITISNEP